MKTTQQVNSEWLALALSSKQDEMKWYYKSDTREIMVHRSICDGPFKPVIAKISRKRKKRPSKDSIVRWAIAIGIACIVAYMIYNTMTFGVVYVIDQITR